jgi:hypothetical protein
MFDPKRHIALTPEPWDEAAARSEIETIVVDAVARFDPVKFWPSHPNDDGVPDGSEDLYLGAAGVIWAIDYLKRQGMAASTVDFTSAIPHLIAENAESFAGGPYPQHGSLLFGDIGVKLLAMRLAPSSELADALYDRVAVNLGLPILELMWGMPGTMLACVHMAAMTGESRWREPYQAQATRLLGDLRETADGPLWDIAVYGETRRWLGPVHGFAGHMLALIRGWDWLDAAQQRRVGDTAQRALARNAVRDDLGAKWPAVAGRPAPHLVQYCHGAPGMVAALSDLPLQSPEFDQLLREGAELTWHAGPLAKGSNLCHGTGGNGYAFLKLHRRLGDPIWLERARIFAMAAMRQCQEARQQLGRSRYALWTGDLGLAVYLMDCIRSEPKFPTIDVF